MFRRVLSVFLLVSLLSGSVASAQSGGNAASQGGGGTKALWTAVGAGAGFGVGVWIGLNTFDDAINSDRKVWTTAIVSAAAGGALGYLFGRARSGKNVRIASSAPFPTRPPASEASPGVLSAPPLGSGGFEAWLRRGRAVEYTAHIFHIEQQ